MSAPRRDPRANAERLRGALHMIDGEALSRTVIQVAIVDLNALAAELERDAVSQNRTEAETER